MGSLFVPILILLSFLTLTPALSETIRLKSGKTVEGEIVEKTSDYIKVDISGIPITYYFEDIENIGKEPNLPPKKDHRYSIEQAPNPSLTPSSPLEMLAL